MMFYQDRDHYDQELTHRKSPISVNKLFRITIVNKISQLLYKTLSKDKIIDIEHILRNIPPTLILRL